MIEVDSYEPAALADSLGVERTALKAGDLRLTHEGETVLIERKTWDDAYGAWQSQRLEAQITKMLSGLPCHSSHRRHTCRCLGIGWN